MYTSEDIMTYTEGVLQLYYSSRRNKYRETGTTCPVNTSCDSCYCLTKQEIAVLHAFLSYSIDERISDSHIVVNPIPVLHGQLGEVLPIEASALRECTNNKRERAGYHIPASSSISSGNSFAYWFDALHAIWVLERSIIHSNVSNQSISSEQRQGYTLTLITAGLLKINSVFAHDYFRALISMIVNNNDNQYELLKKTKELVTEILAWSTWSDDIEHRDWGTFYIQKLQEFKIAKNITYGLKSYILNYSSSNDIRLHIEKNQVVPWVTRFIKIIDQLDVDSRLSRLACIHNISELQKEVCFLF